MDVQASNRAALAAVRIRRDALYEGILGLERVIGTPAGDAPDAWAALVAPAVDRVCGVMASHVADTEEPGGIFEDIIATAPGLVHAVDRLKADHSPLLEAATTLRARLDDVTDEPAVDQMRDAALDLIRALLDHRHRGAELVYDAYSVDVATGD
jgi:hypothetical protein